MRVIEILSKYLESLGMSKDQADSVLLHAKIEMKSDLRLDDLVSDYPSMMINIWKRSVKRIGLEWIIKNKPQAWFKPMFES